MVKFYTLICIDNPIYRLGVMNFGLFTIENLDDYHSWMTSNPVEIIENISLSSSAKFIYLEPDSLNATLDLNVEVSSVNLFISDYLMLSAIELLFAIQDAYNSYEEDPIVGDEFEEAKIDEEINQKDEINIFSLVNIDNESKNESTDQQEIKYEIITPEAKPLEVSEEKLHKWEEQVNQQIQLKLGGFKITLSERNDESSTNVDFIYSCLEVLNVDIKIANKGLYIDAQIYRLFIQDRIISQQLECSSNPMPKMFCMIVCNPKLETTLAENTEKYNIPQEVCNQLLIKITHSKLETNVELTLNNLRIAPNEKTLERLVKFILKIIGSLNSKTDQLEKLKDEYLKYALGAGLELKEITDKLRNVKYEDEQGFFNSLVKIREQYLIKEKGIKVIQLEKLEERQTLKIYGTINNIECLIPLEWSKSDAKIMSLTLSSEFFFYSFKHRDYYVNNLTNMIFKMEDIRSVIDASASLKNVELKIEQAFENDLSDKISSTVLQKERNILKSRLLKCGKAEVRFDQESKIQDFESDMICHITVTQIDVGLGFTDIIQFKLALNRIIDLSSSITNQNKVIIKKISEDYSYVRSKTQTIQVNKEKLKMEISRFAKRKEISTIKFTLTADGLSCSFIDDTGLHHQSLINVDFSSLKATLNLENGKESAKSYILRKMGIYEYPTIQGNLSVKLKSTFHNYESGSDEPLIESCCLHASIKESLTEIKIDKEYVNINLTYGVSLAIK